MKLKELINKKYLLLTKKINEIIGNKKYYIDNDIDINEKHMLHVYSSERKKKMISVEYEIMGFYNKDCETFYWGDLSIPRNKNINRSLKKIKKLKHKLKNQIINKKYTDVDFLEKILYYISNNVFYINIINIDDLIKYSCYKTDSLGILIQETKIDNKIYIMYYFVKEIIQID